MKEHDNLRFHRITVAGYWARTEHERRTVSVSSRRGGERSLSERTVELTCVSTRIAVLAVQRGDEWYLNATKEGRNPQLTNEVMGEKENVSKTMQHKKGGRQEEENESIRACSERSRSRRPKSPRVRRSLDRHEADPLGARRVEEARFSTSGIARRLIATLIRL